MDPKALVVAYEAGIFASGHEGSPHLCWMCREMYGWLELLASPVYDRENKLLTMLKFRGWLGYVQHYMEGAGLRSIDQLRNETRGLDAVLIGYL